MSWRTAETADLEPLRALMDAAMDALLPALLAQDGVAGLSVEA